MQQCTSPQQLLQLLQNYNINQDELREILRSDPQRFNKFSLKFNGLLFDFSRVRLDQIAFALLLDLFKLADIARQRVLLFDGARLNLTENRPVLHHLWRSRQFSSVLSNEEAAACESALVRMHDLSSDLHSGYLPGDSNVPITDVIHVGIGGSLIGPRLLCEALPAGKSSPNIHFLSSVDAFDREQLLTRLNPATTTIVLVSKSFSTSEVLAHGKRLQSWMEVALGSTGDSRRTFAVSSAAEKAKKFGVPEAQILPMGEWTGGRFSVWSPVGFTVAISAGPKVFDRFCAGGAAMDEHFRNAPAEQNLPVIHGFLSCWHRNVCAYSTRGLIPYDSRLRGLPGWLQQVQMESNGKSVTRTGIPAQLATSPIVLGESGTDAQHSLFQAFHQGTEIVPLDFVGVIRPDHNDHEAQSDLLANLLAQATALAHGRNKEETRTSMQAERLEAADIEMLLPHREMPGNRPSSILMLDDLSPENLGSLMVLYEHSVFVESLVWKINAFDQWGVELGKVLADQIAGLLKTDASNTAPTTSAPIKAESEFPDLTELLQHIRDQSQKP